MKKILYLIFVSLIIKISNVNHCNASKAEECKNLDPGKGNHCCFVEFEFASNIYKFCHFLTEADYDYIKDYINMVEDDFETDIDISIDCSSNYIIISLLTLILLFL